MKQRVLLAAFDRETAKLKVVIPHALESKLLQPQGAGEAIVVEEQETHHSSASCLSRFQQLLPEKKALEKDR